jgi:hypothetical protein
MLRVTFGSVLLCGGGLTTSPHNDVFDQPRDWRIDSADEATQQRILCATVPLFKTSGAEIFTGSFNVSRRHASVQAAEAFLLSHLADVDGIHSLAIRVFAPGADPATATPTESKTMGQALLLRKTGTYDGSITFHAYSWIGTTSVPS